MLVIGISHVRVSGVAGQDMSPCAGCVKIEYVRDWVPSSHALHDPQLTTQSTGISHVRVSGVAGHDLPPCAGCLVIEYVRDWVPSSHALHDPQLTAQSTGAGDGEPLLPGKFLPLFRGDNNFLSR